MPSRSSFPSLETAAAASLRLRRNKTRLSRQTRWLLIGRRLSASPSSSTSLPRRAWLARLDLRRHVAHLVPTRREQTPATVTSHGGQPLAQLEFEDHCWTYCPRASTYVMAGDSYHVGRRKHGASHGSRSLTIRRGAKHAMEQPVLQPLRRVAGVSRGLVLAMNGSPGPSVSLIAVG